MKRYQCIKNVIIEMFEFKQGHIYEFDVKLGFHGYKTALGRVIWIAYPQMGEHFQELLEINVDDHEEEQYTAMLPKTNRLGLGCAIVIAVFLTVLALIFFR